MLVLAVVDYLTVSTLVVLGLCKAASINPAESEGAPSLLRSPLSISQTGCMTATYQGSA